VQTALGPADGAIQLKGSALLAGRKLLLADDSATIQKVIDLTFADEGVRVVAVSNGQDAIEQLLEVAPDIVLADVFMPSPNGYEVCEYVKTNEKLKHIPVMLLVGSFEPFDEAEARRVGADDILTKPFQSIRRLIDRVGALVGSPPAERERPTAELPKMEEAEEPRLNTEELEITTADTLPLDRVDHPAIVSAQRALGQREEKMETGSKQPSEDSRVESSDVLLDLGEFEPARAASSDDFVLDLDDTSEAEVAAQPAYESAPMRAFVEPQVSETTARASAYDRSAYDSAYRRESQNSSFADTQEIAYASNVHDAVAESRSYESQLSHEPAPVPLADPAPEPVPVFNESELPIAGSTPPATSINAAQLSPELIDAIARRAVELMSDKVVREVAWEVVPDLAELLIKRQLEEKQAK
jgi:CheY-like chemotaxis protein